jgi:hypothetical protein
MVKVGELEHDDDGNIDKRNVLPENAKSEYLSHVLLLRGSWKQ